MLFLLVCVRSIPFKGIKGRNGMLFDMVWTKANFFNNEVVVDVNGRSYYSPPNERRAI